MENVCMRKFISNYNVLYLGKFIRKYGVHRIDLSKFVKEY